MNLRNLRARYEEYGLGRIFEEIKNYAKNAVEISLKASDDQQIPIGASKFGGSPDLPRSEPWPVNEQTGEPLHFIAQINFSEVSEFDTQSELPSRGMLYLFYDCAQMPWGYDPKDGAFKKVIYAEDTGELECKVAPFESDESFAATSLKFANTTELPDLESDLVGDIEMSDNEIDAYWQMADDFCEQRGENKILGHSDNIQGGMELECELVTNGFYCGGDEDYSGPEFEKLRQNIGEWTLLLQIGSNDENEMMWCDCGKIYLWIRKSDLRERKFDKSWLVLQCD